MLIVGTIAGLLAGLLAGGSVLNLATVRLRWVAVLLIAVIVRFGTEALLARDVAIVEALRLPLFAGAFGLLLAGLWVNRRHPGLGLAFVGILLNGIAIVVNGGAMPIWEPSLLAAGFTAADVTSPFHTLLSAEIDANFLLRAGPLVDILPVPLPFIQNVASIGDLFLTAGLGFFLFASVVRTRDEEDADADELSAELGEGGEGDLDAATRPGPRLAGLAGTTRLPRGVRAAVLGQRIRPETGLAPGLTESAALDRPRLLGGAAVGQASPAARPIALAPVPSQQEYASELVLPPVTRPRPEVGVRVRRHPYVRLALNGSFSALWAGQLVSLFGDRVHQVALAFLVLGVTGSPLAVAGVFIAATLPNLLLSPIAGTYVDRWDHRDVMIVSDLLRAATVLIIPIAAVTHIALVYPFVFLITSISIFFRPARVAILPRIVREDELLSANSAMWVGETMADIIGYPLAGIFVAFLGSSLPLAFWVDAATYGASAALIAAVVVPPLRRGTGEGDGELAETGRSVLREMREGFRFLRGETTLFANTIQAAVAQFTVGVLTALAPVYAEGLAGDGPIDGTAIYSFLETSIGLGNLAGGFVLGLLGASLARGRAIIAGYTFWGACMVGLAITGNLPVALGLMLGSGIANMVFVIPSQTLFQERTPVEMIGRVIGFRFALVFGSMTIAMGVGGVIAAFVGVPAVLFASGIVTMIAGLAGLLVPALRDA